MSKTTTIAIDLDEVLCPFVQLTGLLFGHYPWNQDHQFDAAAPSQQPNIQRVKDWAAVLSFFQQQKS